MKLAIVGYGKMGRIIEELAPEYGFEVALKLDIDNNAKFEGLTREQFDDGWARLREVGYPAERGVDEVWESLLVLRSHYAAVAEQLLYWTIAAPAPWSGGRRGFPDLSDRPDAPVEWEFS